MDIPEKSISYLFEGKLTKERLDRLNWCINDLGGVKNEEIYWLNTPGPIYTTQTDNCGTGQPEAMNNVGGDENYYEFIFKQPYNETELLEVKSAADIDPLGGYYINGNEYWTNEIIVEWWGKVESIIDYMVDRYDDELKLYSNPHNSLWGFGNGIKEMHLFGPTKPLPENYKSALDFYQFGLKNYLEWYMKTNNGLSFTLHENNYNWDRKLKLDEKRKTFSPQKRDLVAEYHQEQSKSDITESPFLDTKKKHNYWNKLKYWSK
jgi:hypothetical protein